MEFCDFARPLKDILGEEMHAGPFTRMLFEKITIIPENVEHDPLIETTDNTFKAYFTGDRKLTRFVPKLTKYLERTVFVKYIHDLEAEQQTLIYNAFHPVRETMSESNIPEEMADLFMEILSAFIKKPKPRKRRQVKSELRVKRDEPVAVDDFSLLAECNMKCPLCHKRLVETVKGVPLKKYIPIQIFPNNLDLIQQAEFTRVGAQPDDFNSLDNKMLLCRDCAEEYMASPTVNEYQHLLMIKAQQGTDLILQDKVDDITVEQGIQQILEALSKIKGRPKPIDKTKWDAFRVDKKIPDDNHQLQDRVTYWVLRYYHYLEREFKQAERSKQLRFRKIQNEVSQCFEMLDEENKPQAEIFERLVRWLEGQTGCHNRDALETVISFFVQNCEVFNETSE